MPSVSPALLGGAHDLGWQGAQLRDPFGRATGRNPAAELGPLVAGAVGRGIPVVVSLCGTAADPQDRARQAAVLNEAGASVWLSNAAAARHATGLAKGGNR